MPKLLRDHRVFWRQFREHYHTTGAVAPSGRLLAGALARYVGRRREVGQRLLEVGPGTGAVTGQIVRRMGPADELDLVELNAVFVRRLRERFAVEEPFRSRSTRLRVVHARLQDLPREGQYDLIVSGLPLNNFAIEDVQQVLVAFHGLLRPGGVLSFFEYVAVRRAKALVSGRAERARLRSISRQLAQLLGPHEIRRDCIWPNLPPAWVHHVRLAP
jgi:phospholipid N-methyltransferase